MSEAGIVDYEEIAAASVAPVSPTDVVQYLGSAQMTASRLAIALRLLPPGEWPDGAANHAELAAAVDNATATSPPPGDAEDGSLVGQALQEVSEYKLPRPQRAFLGRVGRAMMEAIQVIGKS